MNRRLIAIVAASIALAACNPRPEDVPGSVPSGNVEQTTAASEAYGAGGTTAPPIAHMSVAQMAGPAPQIPYVYTPDVRHAWFFPSLNTEEDVLRTGFWASIMVKRGEFAMKRSLYRNRLGLEQLTGMEIDSHGRPVVGARPVEVDDRARDAISQLGRELRSNPWVDGGSTTPMTRTTIVQPDGRTTQYMAPAGASSVPTTTAAPSMSDVQRVLDEAQRQMQTYENKPPNNAGQVNQGLRDSGK